MLGPRLRLGAAWYASKADEVPICLIFLLVLANGECLRLVLFMQQDFGKAKIRRSIMQG